MTKVTSVRRTICQI